MKPFPMAALAGTAAALVLAGCEKKPAGSKVETVPPPKTSLESASGTPETASVFPQDETAAGGGAAASPGPGSQPPAPPEPPIGADTFAAEGARILQLPEGPERDDALSRFVRHSMQGGFERTDEWIRKMPDGQTRDTAYSAFIEDLGHVAPMLALDYVRRVSNPKKRASLEAKLQSSPRMARPPVPGQGTTPVNPHANGVNGDSEGRPEGALEHPP